MYIYKHIHHHQHTHTHTHTHTLIIHPLTQRGASLSLGRDNQEVEGELGLTPVMYAVLYNDMDMLTTVRVMIRVRVSRVSRVRVMIRVRVSRVGVGVRVRVRVRVGVPP